MDSYARARAWVDSADDVAIHIALDGHEGEEWDEWGPMDWIPSEASAEVDALFTIDPNGGYAAGAPLDLLILINLEQSSTSGTREWGCTLYRGAAELAAFGPGVAEAWVPVEVGETLRIVAWMSVSDAYSYNDTLVVSIYTVPEPGTLLLLALGGASILTRRRPRSRLRKRGYG